MGEALIVSRGGGGLDGLRVTRSKWWGLDTANKTYLLTFSWWWTDEPEEEEYFGFAVVGKGELTYFVQYGGEEYNDNVEVDISPTGFAVESKVGNVEVMEYEVYELSL